MMAAQKIDPFDIQQETFSRFIQRVRIHFAANGTADNKQKYVFLNTLTPKQYTLLANLVAPDTPDTGSVDRNLDQSFRT